MSMPPMNSAPKVSVIIPHYSDLERLDICLDALRHQSLSSDFEIIVADNGSPEGPDAVRAVICERARLVVVSEKGAGPARNGGVGVSTAPILAFTDSDCVPEPGWLEAGLKALERCDFVGGRVCVLVEDLQRMTGSEAFERVFAFDFKSYITRKGFTGAGNLFCRREMFDHVGGFGVGVSEDIEWSHRARSMGYRLAYAPQAVVGHPARHNWSALWAKWRRVNLETYGLYRERQFGKLLWLLRSLALPLSAVVHTPRILLSDQLTSFEQRGRAVGTLFKLRSWRAWHAISLLARTRS